jgi:hypothetical protein
MKVIYLSEVGHYLFETVEILYNQNYFSFPEDAIDITYKANARTQWYIFFQLKDDIYLVRYITNNHHPAAQYFVSVE